MVGRLSRFGLHKATMLVPIMVAWPIISPPFWGPQEVVDRTNTTYLGWMAAVFLVGTLFPVIVIPLLMRKRTPPKLLTYTRREAIPYTATITHRVSPGRGGRQVNDGRARKFHRDGAQYGA